MSFTAQLPSGAEWTPPIHILCLAHSIRSGFLRRDDVLMLGSNPKQVVCRIRRKATQIGCRGEQISGEIVICMIDKRRHPPLWWASIHHSGGALEHWPLPYLAHSVLQRACVGLLLVLGSMVGHRRGEGFKRGVHPRHLQISIRPLNAVHQAVRWAESSVADPKGV